MRRVEFLFTLAFVAVVGLFGCATVPKPTVELSEVIDRQISEMQKSHEAFISLYYAKLREDVDRFILEKWTPAFLAQTLAGETEQSKRLLNELDLSYKLIHVDPSAVSVAIDGKQISDPAVKAAIEQGVAQAVKEQRSRFGETMLRYSRGAQRQITRQRDEMLAPIDKQERFVLSELRGGYADLQRASATIKGFLSSAVKVEEQRDQILGKLGLLEKQRKLVDLAMEMSDKTSAVLGKHDDNPQQAIANFQEQIDEAKRKMNELNDKYDEIKKKLKE